MAIVQVDLSEYDMLREAKNKAEQEVKNLKNEIEEWKKNARVIVTTKKCCRLFNYDEIVIETHKLMAFQHYSFEQALQQSLKKIDYDDLMPISNNPSKWSTLCSQQIVGFEDVRLKVEEQFSQEIKDEYETKIREATEAKEKYETAYKKAKEEAIKTVTKEKEFEIETLKEEIDTLKFEDNNKRELLDSYRKKQEELLRERETLLLKCKDSERFKADAHSFELKSIELQKQVDILQHEVNKKKHWWSK